MAYERLVTIKNEDGTDRDIYLHAGKDVSGSVVDGFANRFRENAEKLWYITDYVAVQSGYDERWYRIYQSDHWTFWVENSRS